MLKLKVSYQEEQELKDFLELLPGQVVLSVKVPKKQTGPYTKAYIKMDMVADKEPDKLLHFAGR